MSEARILRGENLTLQFGPRRLMADLSVEVAGGEVLGITGPTGSGKTSLLHVLGGLLEPSAGRVCIDGVPGQAWRTLSVGIVLQRLQLLGMHTAHETVALPLQARGGERAVTAERADAALAELGLADHAHQLVQELSGGQRQRVALARAFAAHGELILMDEPTSALDARWRTVVLERAAAAAAAGAMVIVASSDPTVMEGTSKVLSLEPSVTP